MAVHFIPLALAFIAIVSFGMSNNTLRIRKLEEKVKQLQESLSIQKGLTESARMHKKYQNHKR